MGELVLNLFVFAIEDQFGLQETILRTLRVEHLERWVVSEVKILGYVRQRVVWLPHFFTAVGVSTVFAKAALAFFEEVLAFLGFEVIVGDVHHFELDFEW